MSVVRRSNTNCGRTAEGVSPKSRSEREKSARLNCFLKRKQQYQHRRSLVVRWRGVLWEVGLEIDGINVESKALSGQVLGNFTQCCRATLSGWCCTTNVDGGNTHARRSTTMSGIVPHWQCVSASAFEGNPCQPRLLVLLLRVWLLGQREQHCSPVLGTACHRAGLSRARSSRRGLSCRLRSEP